MQKGGEGGGGIGPKREKGVFFQNMGKKAICLVNFGIAY